MDTKCIAAPPFACLCLPASCIRLFGFCIHPAGATVGKMPCLAISSTTTAYGRQMIESTRTWVQVGGTALYITCVCDMIAHAFRCLLWIFQQQWIRCE